MGLHQYQKSKPQIPRFRTHAWRTSIVHLISLAAITPVDRVTAQFAVPMVTIPATHHQPLGPIYSYRIGRYEVTNKEFADFLNDARVNPATNGSFVTFHPLTATVTLAGDATLLFDPAIGGDISFDATAQGGSGAYMVAAGRGGFPVTGVTWIGAVKYCNWLTVAQGMTAPDQRVYNEGPTAADWFPLVVPPAAYATRDLTAGERATMVAQYRGFRLPMDDHAATAGPYNEWYKAAAWLDGPKVNALFGFGRDVLNAASANYKSSGDPFEEGPVPVGFFGVDGSRAQTDPLFGWPMAPPTTFAVSASANGYGLHDVSGNVAEWVQDWGDVAGEKVTRGGHFGNVLGSAFLRNNTRLSRPATTAQREIGFRVAQAIIPPLAAEVPVVQDVIRIDGTVGGPFSAAALTITARNLTTQTIDDIALTPSHAGLVAPQAAGNQIVPGGMVDYAVTIDPLKAGETETPPASDLVLVSGDDIQSGGPTHDFWIGRTEVTNAQFAAFLNDALNNAKSMARNERSRHMYFDTDSGNVYVGDQADGAVGVAAPSATLATLMYDVTLGRITFNGTAYVVAGSFAQHPVVGVTWFGAVKYCNWRSLNEGMPPAFLAYAEAPAPALDQWRPVTLVPTAWQPGLFDATARGQWVSDTLGYRLPMDAEAVGASLYNEWHKAASFRGPDAMGFPQFDAVYGFGRDAVTDVDANTLRSGDAFEPGTTPVSTYDGVQRLTPEPSDCLAVQPSGKLTNPTANGYKIYDLAGNVAEWLTDFGADALQRGVRGGSWRTDRLSPLLTSAVRDSFLAHIPADDVGFRVVRGAGRVTSVRLHSTNFGIDHTAYLMLHARRPLSVWPYDDTLWSMSYGVTPALSTTFLVSNRGAGTIAARARVDVPWLSLQSFTLAPVSGGELAGSIFGLNSAYVDVNILPAAAALAPGEHIATLSVTDETSAVTVARRVRLTVTAPATLREEDLIPADFHGFPGGPFMTSVLSTKFPPDATAFILTNVSSRNLSYELGIDRPWIELEAIDPLMGTLPAAPGLVGVLGKVDATVAAALSPGVHEARLSANLTDAANNDLVTTVAHTVRLKVEDWVDVQPATDWTVTHIPQQTPLAMLPIQLHNRATSTVDMRVCVDRPWLEAEATDLELAAGQMDVTMVTLTDAAEELENGVHEGSIVITDLVTGAESIRAVKLTVSTTFAVTPGADYVTTAIAGGAVRVPAKVYVLTNGGPVTLAWAAAPGAGAPWVRINGQAAATGTIPPFSAAPIVVSVDAAQTALLPAGLHTVAVNFTDTTNNLIFSRTIDVTVVAPQFTVGESVVSASAAQPSGPAHTFALGTFHVTNAEFAAFLNSALANPTNERGQYMYFDTTTGDVYVNFATVGESGTGAGGRTVKMFAPAVAGLISFDGVGYQVVTAPIDATNHPVTGVSWYGAVKFTNWLTIDQGFTPAQRCYAESSAALLAGWRPVNVSDTIWAARDLTDAERQVFVTSCPGFRLPMDDAVSNVNPAFDAADLYNEWFKAAAWDRVAGVNRLYGFGRDLMATVGAGAGLDANYRCSADPFENAADCTLGMTTPVGYYGGPGADPAYPATPTANSFGIHDLSGNVHQWMQCRYSPHAQGINFRAIRGGSFNDVGASDLLKSAGRTFTTASATSRYVGFRVARVLPPVSADLDASGVVDELDYLLLSTQWTGPLGLPTAAGVAFDLDQDGDVDLADFARLSIAFN